MTHKVNKVFFVVLSLFLSLGSIDAQELRVASYNLRYDNPADSLNNWQYRKDIVAKLIQFHDFDIFGSQEGLQHMLAQLSNKLPEYSYIGVGRDDGEQKGEHSAIFYKTKMFQLLDKGDFWLSENTSRPNVGWDAALPRIVSWGKFKVKQTGMEFYFFNTHFDHVGVQARKESAKLILRKINDIAKDKPTLLTGDFNVDQNSASFKVLNGSDLLSDAYALAELQYGAEGTFNGFKINTRSESRIDHVFVSRDFKVLKHGILTDTYHTNLKTFKEEENSGAHPREISIYKNEARLTSDHYPVLSILKYDVD
ncbi:Metal-dependent hydrolase, endonuclease/exonuclease/phosphatase family [Salegentibacter echinorum]|uniref:Metal-dependent hydrolase, endonuclease/exonuclease/phosphatase family n=1 Tax=Salegentibacter echinorum TaxID=1073325 RepID=A0A1M5HXR7_SALEC|nr:endonuclease/exonuclease/phosphatase family protein [Salegentibacter echinorum]SHG20660.1 Metal-dependent hydrolase, endonuclease/exonuclease/phosphatase family [Salegentibacter echinorum]